jgi:hypothetical protein
MQQLKKLYNGIINDVSIQRYSMGWSDVVTMIEARYKTPIKKTNEVFTDDLLLDALLVTSGKLRKSIESMISELQINNKTLSDKQTLGTQRSPFGIGS